MGNLCLVSNHNISKSEMLTWHLPTPPFAMCHFTLFSPSPNNPCITHGPNLWITCDLSCHHCSLNFPDSGCPFLWTPVKALAIQKHSDLFFWKSSSGQMEMRFPSTISTSGKSLPVSLSDEAYHSEISINKRYQGKINNNLNFLKIIQR